MQERVYPETEWKVEGCDEQEDQKNRIWELEESDFAKLIAALDFHPQRLAEDAKGVSPTEREFDRVTAIGTHRLIFVKGVDDGARNPKILALIEKAQAGLIRKRLNTAEELVVGLYASLVVKKSV